MKKIKKITLLLWVGLMLATPLIGLIPTFEGRASAATVDNATLAEQMESYLFVRGLARCLQQGSNKQIKLTDVGNYDWFYGSKDTYIGYLDANYGDDSNGKLDCEKVNGWIQYALTLWGWGDLAPEDQACAIGFGGWCNDKSLDYVEYTPGGLREPFLKSVNKQFYGKDSTALPTMTEAMKYLYYSKSFLVLCGPTANSTLDNVDPHPVADYISGKETGYDLGGDNNQYRMVNGDAATTTSYKASKDAGDHVSTRVNDDLEKNELPCGEIVNHANMNAKDYLAYMDAHPDEAAAIKEEEDLAGKSPEVKCADEWDLIDVINPLDWLSCSLLKGFNTAAQAFDDLIMGMLCVNENDIFGTHATCGTGVHSNKADTDQMFHQAWNVFRIIALGLLAIGGLIMIISQGLGFELFDAYTVKRTMPRLIVAAIGITLSWQIMAFMVTLSNGLGIGIRSLIYAPFSAGGLDEVVLGGGASAITALFAGGAFVALGSLGLLSFIGTALLAILIAFIILVVRNIVVILLILIAPVAIAAYILPNTEKYFKTWWEWLLKTLLVFPLITAFIAIGHVFAAITSTQGGAITNFVAFAAYFAPYFMIPLAFRFVGGLMATLGGFANDKSRGAFDRLKGFRKNEAARLGQKRKNFDRFDERTAIGRGLNTALGAGSNPTTLLSYRRGIKAGNRAVAARRQAGQTVQGQAMLKDNVVHQANMMDDNYLVAAMDMDLAKELYAADQTKYNAAVASGDMVEAQKHQQSMVARQKGMDAAERLPFFTRQNASVRAEMLNALTQTGYQFDENEKGYEQLSRVARSIAGGDEGVYAQLMDQSQYNLRAKGQRFDLGGINHGAGYDSKTGLAKGSLYELAHSKGGVSEMGSAPGPVGKEHAVAYKELEAMLNNTTGSAQKAVVKQMDALRSRGVEEYMATTTTENQVVRYSPREERRAAKTGNTWTAAEKAQGWRREDRTVTLGEQAGREARAWERPDPNNQ